jgi:hypothetical protein
MREERPEMFYTQVMLPYISHHWLVIFSFVKHKLISFLLSHLKLITFYDSNNKQDAEGLLVLTLPAIWGVGYMAKGG